MEYIFWGDIMQNWPSCKKCANEFEKNEIIKSVWLSNSIKCKNCNTINYISKATRKIAIFSVLIPMFIHINKFSYIGEFIWIFLMIFIMPNMYAKYNIECDTNEEINEK